MAALAVQLPAFAVPADRVVFTGALACHITSGLTCVVTGVLATTAAKRPGRHTSAGTLGYLARRRRWRGWLRIHLLGMSGSYIALLTGFYVDNGRSSCGPWPGAT